MKTLINKELNGNSFVCYNCGYVLTGKEPGIATYHINNCENCGSLESVTQLRDFTGIKFG